jgi:hypothetical protein
MTSEPRPPFELWGLWLTDSGEDPSGRWVQHARGSFNGPQVYTHKATAELAAVQEQESFRGTAWPNAVVVAALIGVHPDRRAR